VYLVFKFTATKGLETSLKESKGKYKVAHWLQEIARSLVSFKISGRTTLAMQRNNKLTEEYLDARESHFKVLMLQFIQMIGFKVLVTAGLLIIGGLLVLNQQMNIGQFVAAEIIILLVISSVEKLITGLESFYDILTSLEKIGQVVDKKLETQEGIDPFENTDKVSLQLDNVSYETPESGPILSDITLRLETGERVLIDGLSGSGKTTLLKILSGIYEPTTGSIYVNDFSFKGMRPNAYRSQIGQVLPEQSPFEGTILENISFGNPDITAERVLAVAKIVGLQDFVRKQSNGINTFIFPEGQQIPHTISKRLLLARAIVHEPKVLLLKDALEHFESKEAKEIIHYLASPDRPWALVVSSSINDWKTVCNQFIELDSGKIISKKS